MTTGKAFYKKIAVCAMLAGSSLAMASGKPSGLDPAWANILVQ